MSIDDKTMARIKASSPFAGVAEVFGDEAAGVVVEFLDPDAVAVDFALDVAVGRARNPHSYGTRCAVTRQTNDADIMSKIFSAELCAETYFTGFFEHLLL